MTQDNPESRKRTRDPEKVCGAKTDHGPCQQWKGARTDHVGFGRCYRHGGSSPNGTKAAEKEQTVDRMRTYGAPIDTDPVTALSEEVRRTAGHVAWLGELVGDLLHDGDGYSESISDDGKRVLRSNTGLTQMDTAGRFEKESVWLTMYREERQHLARVCQMAISLGVQQKQLDVIKTQGEAWISLFRAVLDDRDLGLTEDQRQTAKVVMLKQYQKLNGAA